MDKYITSDKIFYHLGTLNDWENGATIKPVTLEIHPSNKCNNDCYYCSSNGTKDGHMMSLMEIRKAVNNIHKLGARGLIFSGGGEPLCNPFTIRSLKHAKQLGLSVGIITNGLMINEDNAGELLKHCEWIRISLDSLNTGIYQLIRGVNGLSQAEKALALLLRKRAELGYMCTIGVQTVINRYNYKDIYNFAEKIEREFRKIDYIQIRPLEITLGSSPYSKKELTLIKQELDKIYKDKTIRKTILSTKLKLIFGAREHGFSACHCYGMIGTIHAYGDIYICCHTVKQPIFKYGNIIHDKTSDIFKRRAAVAKKTIKYRLHKICPIGCRGSAINRRLQGLMTGKEHKNFL